MDNNSNGASEPLPRTLSEQAARFAELQHENFNLKMRVSYLEDKLLSLGNGVTALASDELEAEVIRLRRAVDERDHQLAEQNASIARGNQAIDALTEQLRESQAAIPQVGEVGQTSLALQNAVEAAQRRVYELEEEVETLHQELQESQNAHQRDVGTSEQWKQCYQETLEYLKREGVRALHEVKHLRDLNNSKDNMLTRSRELLEDARRQKRQQGSEYITRLKRFSEEAKRLGEQEERLHAKYQADYARLESNWMDDQTGLVAQNTFFRDEIATLRRPQRVFYQSQVLTWRKELEAITNVSTAMCSSRRI
ncbi:hypothetical protein PF005_g12436 [Phytophthora fragariae]|uniref:Centrosomin N-terminal motif 1 domain-containing protein n=1 Tax=Phytophthora fragariae TaxID=53985 RepID=A0A6A3Z4K6_9STRA|nr:hypothetical protein PF009_g16657 [Phytophthora fragariae]KAE8999087.1 hypothetical protein PF011_g14769 [Phytophthora fragariae]KAE9100550.1 hypothetical protein PF007_g15465 [Phytophthora fragariae]KAE9100667.1 hypothetical protein PF010_g14736 [Phytophthora fragariae]KAE9143919.1 hypothetical protein PF006_g11090 [Phytophthora fragariae]